MRRAMGTDRRERVLAERYRPYSYESNSAVLRYAGVALAIWVAVALGLAWSDRSNASLYGNWSRDGLVAIPPSVDALTPAALDQIFAYSESEGLQCTTIQHINQGTAECDIAIERSRKFGESQNRSLFLFVGLMFATIATAFPFSAFTNRASRNLLTLRSAGQKFSPEWAVLWLFIPVMNAVRPVQVFRELFRASDPNVGVDRDRDWKDSGRVPLILYAWWPLFVVSIFFNPIFIPRIWASQRLDVQDLIATSNLLFWSDLVIAVMGVAAFFMLRELNLRQEARHAMIGDIVVTRPLPRSPFGDAVSIDSPETGDSTKGDNR